MRYLLGLMLVVSVLQNTVVWGQWGGAESLQRRQSGILGGYFYTAYIPLLDNPSAFMYGEKIHQTDISFLKFLAYGKIARQNFLIGFEQEHSNYLQQSSFLLGFGKKISKQVSLGIKMGYDGIHASGYGSKGKLNSGFGFFLRATDKINWALQLNHIESLSATSEWKHFEAKVGMGWMVSELCGISLAMHIMEKQKAKLELGLYYQFLDKARIRMEFETNDPCLRMSLGYQFPFLQAEIFSNYQTTGNTSYGVGLFIQLRKKSV